MTAGELIAKLQKFNPDTPVLIATDTADIDVGNIEVAYRCVVRVESKLGSLLGIGPLERNQWHPPEGNDLPVRAVVILEE